MRRQYRAALGIVGLAVVTAAVGLGVFLYFGSQVGVYVIGAGIPLTVIVATGLYVRGVLARSTTSEGEFVHEAARSAAEAFREALTTFNRLDADYSRWEPDGVGTRAEQLADDFDDAGVRVDVAAATFTVGSPDRVREFDRLREAVDSFADERDRAFVAFARDESDRARAAAGSVTGVVSDRTDDPVSAAGDDLSDDASVDEAERLLARARERAAEAYEDAAERIESTVDDYGGDAAAVDSHLADARARVERNDWEGAMEAVVDAQAAAESEVDEAFSADREALDELLSTVESVGVEPHAEPRHLDTFADARERLRGIDSALASEELDAAAAEVRSAAVGVVETLERDLDRHVDTIRGADVPMGFYTAPPAVAADYTADLADVESLGAFRTEWLAATGDLVDAVEEAETKASVAETYGTVEDRIDEELRSDGRVTAADLPVRDPEPFLELYADAHPSAEYDPAAGALVVEGGGESYEVRVATRLAASTGEEHDVTVALRGETIDERETSRTFVATEVTFESVPYGEYTVTASTPDGGFADAETTLHVADDAAVDLTLAEVSLRERVCGDDDDDVREQLPAVASKLDAEFADAEYLTPASDIPVADEYVPCVLVLWAEREGLEARMDDGAVLVYDHDQFRSRLETIITHNLSDDDSMTYDDMRKRFLSVPASDRLIGATLAELDVDVTVDGTEVRA